MRLDFTKVPHPGPSTHRAGSWIAQRRVGGHHSIPLHTVCEECCLHLVGRCCWRLFGSAPSEVRGGGTYHGVISMELLATDALQAMTSSLTSLRAKATRLNCMWRLAEALQRTLCAYTHQHCTFPSSTSCLRYCHVRPWLRGLLRDGGVSVPVLTGSRLGLKCMAARNGCGSPITLGDAAKSVGLSQLRTHTAASGTCKRSLGGISLSRDVS